MDYNYTLDRLNRSSVVDNGAVINFDANGMNQYVGIGGQTAQYDQNFNLSQLNGWRYGYDAEKHLMVTSNGGSSASFVYDGLGRCVKRTLNGITTRLIYDGWKAIMEFSPQTNHLVAWNIYGPGADEILWRWVEGVGHMRYQHDIHGNVTALLGFYGGVIERYTYDVFGSPTILSTNNTQLSTSAYGNRFMFQGREFFPELGIYDYRHRMYHPGLGRFLQTDPTGFDAGDMNLFRYTGDDPVDRSDPTGLESDGELEQLSIRATLKAAKNYRTKNPEGLGRAVWGAHRRDGKGYEEFPASATIQEGYVRHGPVKRWEGHEIERAPDVDRRVYDRWGYVGHVHGRKGQPDWSDKDVEVAGLHVVITRADARDIDDKGTLKPGHTVKRAVARRDGKVDTRDVYEQPGPPSRATTSALSSQMSDALNYASMFMSFGGGAESVNRTGGPL
jgi:RHS repeat-associated protein